MLIHSVKKGETLWSISEDYRVPLSNLILTNNITNPNMIMIGQQIIIPGLPDPNTIPYQIKVFLGRKKLQLLKNNVLIKEYPIAIGRILHATPSGSYVVVNRQPNPGGPFGSMWLSLSKKHYGIHGTNNPSSIGKAVSLGCIRMYNADVLELASTIPNGTLVNIN
ncbi:L,D-transpeptidase family protein [Lottiidibacillus patelloidae]|uniref:L,D-transpeptidase family protein n=1 Tax=Lottiidibacillus patelloidae TaxID=2670334 RepID=UPI001E3EC02E|nr:L,D-transpeptidase family protein [Lottiidibacillus patelloidae]